MFKLQYLSVFVEINFIVWIYLFNIENQFCQYCDFFILKFSINLTIKLSFKRLLFCIHRSNSKTNTVRFLPLNAIIFRIWLLIDNGYFRLCGLGKNQIVCWIKAGINSVMNIFYLLPNFNCQYCVHVIFTSIWPMALLIDW